MAVIQYSALVTQLRGKLGGSQFNKGHAGYTLQRKSTPTIRQTKAQQIQRQRVAMAQRMWKEETEARKLQAQQCAMANPTVDRFGQQVVLSGYNQYVKMMTYRQLHNPFQGPNPFTNAILTTSVNSARLELNISSLAYVTRHQDGMYEFLFSGTRQRIGTPTGNNSWTNAYLYFTRADQYGRPLPRAKRQFVTRLAYNDDPFDGAGIYFYSSQYFVNTEYVILTVETVNTGAGAITGLQETLIPVS